MAKYKKKLEEDIRCPLEYGLTIFGGKWESRIICVLSAKEKLRYSGLRKECRSSMLKYTEQKIFTQEQVQKLFLSVNWISGNYPERLYKALMHSSTVLTAWDDEKLVGITRVLDDTEMLAQVHYVIVHPDYQGKGIAGQMIEYIKEKYKNFLYIEGMPEDKKNVPFYVKHGISVMENGAAIQICNLDEN